MMNRAIRTLITRIDVLHQKIDEHQRFVDEPEMNFQIEFAMNDIANFQREIEEIQDAIKILNDNVKNR